MRKLIPALTFARQDTRSYDIVHYHGDDYLCRGSRRRVRTFYGSAREEARHARSLRRLLYQSLFYSFELISCLRAGIKVGISQATCDSLPPVKKHIPCGVPLEMYRPANNKTEHPSILFIGDLHSRKRGSLLIETFHSRVLPRYPTCMLSIIGPQRVEGEGIYYLGQIDEQLLVAEYQRSWVYCMTSSYEGFGVPAIEAMACGTPVVAIDNPGTRDIIDNGTNGILTTDTDLGRDLNTILSDETLRTRFSKDGLSRVKREYDINLVASRYEALYQQTRTG